MVLTYRTSRPLLAVLIPVLIGITSAAAVSSQAFLKDPQLFATAVTIDLAALVPLLYFLIIRKTRIPKTTVLPVFIAAILYADFLLPEAHQSLLEIIITYIFPLSEIAVLSLISVKVWKTIKLFREERQGNPDFLDSMRKVTSAMLKNNFLSTLLAAELSAIYYAFFARKAHTDNKVTFSGYRESGITALLATVLFLLLLETAILHILLIRWNEIVAWVVFFFSVYTCLQLFAHIRALTARPILISDRLYIRTGLAGDAEVPFENIGGFESTGSDKKTEDSVHLALLKDLEQSNFVLSLKKPAKVTGFMGMKKKAKTLYFYVDNKAEFEKALRSKIQSKGL